MRKKYLFIGMVIVLAFIVIYMGNIIYAIASNSEDIDKHTFNVMIQGLTE